MSAPSDPTRFVLVDTSHPGNVGAAARALKVMGFGELVLVAPRQPDLARRQEAIARASGAVDVLERTRVVATLAEALDGVTYACATAMTPRDFGPPTHAPRELFATLAAEPPARVAFVFGGERFGMSNDDVYRCHAVLSIPTNPDYGSLNLAQAVQLMAWELRMATLAGGCASPGLHEAPATADQMERFFEHLFATLHAIDFHKGRSAVTIEQRLRRLFHRAMPDARELRILHGVLADAERMARLAREGAGNG